MPIIRRKPIFKKESSSFKTKPKEKNSEKGRDNPNKLIKKRPVRNPNKKN